jgi:uncharacterized protein YlxW (UPF0749 family)
MDPRAPSNRVDDGLRATLVAVSAGSHATSPHGRPRDRRRNVWRIGTPVVVLLCGGLFVVSAANSGGSDLRPGRYTDLASLVKDEADQYDALRTQVASLNTQVGALTATMNDRDVERARRKVERLEDPAGLVARQGTGVRITLSDAPEDLINSTTGDVNRLLVHQQDIQAVVNALWKGGATAVTIAGQRVVSTTGIRCEGNSVQLQGVPYPQPYVIEAVGDQGSLLTAIEDDSYVSAYRGDAADPSVSVGWELQLEDTVVAPAYDGLRDLTYAVPLTGGGSSAAASGD